MPHPIDTATGQRSGNDVHLDYIEVVVGYHVTLPDGFVCRMAPDRTRAENYAIQQRAVLLEPMYVKRFRGA